jgi:hypothetical protein
MTWNSYTWNQIRSHDGRAADHSRYPHISFLVSNLGALSHSWVFQNETLALGVSGYRRTGLQKRYPSNRENEIDNVTNHVGGGFLLHLTTVPLSLRPGVVLDISDWNWNLHDTTGRVRFHRTTSTVLLLRVIRVNQETRFFDTTGTLERHNLASRL